MNQGVLEEPRGVGRNRKLGFELEHQGIGLGGGRGKDAHREAGLLTEEQEPWQDAAWSGGGRLQGEVGGVQHGNVGRSSYGVMSGPDVLGCCGVCVAGCAGGRWRCRRGAHHRGEEAVSPAAEIGVGATGEGATCFLARARAVVGGAHDWEVGGVSVWARDKAWQKSDGVGGWGCVPELAAWNAAASQACSGEAQRQQAWW